MVVYYLINFTVIDQAKYEEYSVAGQALIGPLIMSGKAKILVFANGDSRGVLEGNPPNQLIVIEFESREIAEGWYHSDEYKVLSKKRQEATENYWAVLTDKFVPQF